jgi:antitoxin (DNA-binding transcriptional repressor) of toxin-antitoxin stability system
MPQIINIDEAEYRLFALIAEIEKSGIAVTICRNAKPVAELRPYAAPLPNPFAADPELRVIFHRDPSLLLDPEDWPEAFS